MSVDYQILMCTNQSSLFKDSDNMVVLNKWLKDQHGGYPRLNKLEPKSFGPEFWYCDYVKGLDQEELVAKIKSMEWSDHMFLMISSNSDPFEKVI